jgi:hypothetical protein
MILVTLRIAAGFLLYQAWLDKRVGHLMLADGPPGLDNLEA